VARKLSLVVAVAGVLAVVAAAASTAKASLPRDTNQRPAEALCLAAGGAFYPNTIWRDGPWGYLCLGFSSAAAVEDSPQATALHDVCLHAFRGAFYLVELDSAYGEVVYAGYGCSWPPPEAG
jgi:hypothetical protein